MLLAGDVGGTKTLLGLFERGNPRPRAVETRTYSTNSFGSFTEILDAFARDVHKPFSVDAAAAGETYTEDASLFFARGGGEVKILPGSERNLKITHPSDLITAEALYADWRGGGG